MTEAFYLTATPTVGGTWYKLMTTRTHFCISCGSDLDTRLRVLKDCVKRHRTEERLLESLSKLDCGGKVSPATFKQCEDYYQKHGKDYEDLVKSIVLEGLREAREEDKANNPFRKTTSRLKKAGRTMPPRKTVEEKPKEVSTPAKDSTVILRKKPRVFNRK